MQTKQIMLILMSVLLLLTVIMASIVLDRVGGLFQLINVPEESTGTTQSSSPTSPTANTDASSVPTDTTIPTTPLATDPAHVHNLTKSQTVSPTCTNWGYTVYACSCGKTDTRDFVDPKGHNYSEPVVVPVSCETDGYTQRTCSRCNDVDKQDVTPALGHDYKLTKAYSSTCVDDGYEEHTCSNCKNTKKENVKVAPGHSFSDWTVTEAATDTTPGKTQRTCDTCHKVETQGILPLQKGTITQFLNTDEEWTSYVIRITWKNPQKVDTYNVYIGLSDRGIGYEYTDDGLTITYTVNGAEKKYTFPLDEENPVLTVNKNGKISAYAPGTEPEEPEESEDPDASEPGTSEPGTSEPGTSEPSSSEPDSSEPDSSEPDSSEPGSSEPDASQ